MADIGIVFRDSYEKDGKDVPIISIDFRTITFRKKFTISVNRYKWESGIAGKGTVSPGKENHPDYHIWGNFSKRGESLPSQIVGSIKDMVSDGGVKYKKGYIFDPFLQRESVYFTLFAIDEAKKKNPNDLYNVVAEPYRKMNNQQQGYNSSAQPDYAPQSYQQPMQNEQRDPQQPQEKKNADTPQVNTDNDEIPF